MLTTASPNIWRGEVLLVTVHFVCSFVRLFVCLLVAEKFVCLFLFLYNF